MPRSLDELTQRIAAISDRVEQHSQARERTFDRVVGRLDEEAERQRLEAEVDRRSQAMRDAQENADIGRVSTACSNATTKRRPSQRPTRPRHRFSAG